MATKRSADPSASLIGDLAALGRSQRSKVVVLGLAALVAVALAANQAVDPGAQGKAEHPGRALLLLDHPNSHAADLVRRGGFEITRSSLADATATAREALGLQEGSDIDAIRRWADHEGIGYLLLRHRGPEGVSQSEDPRLQVALEALAHVREEGDAARYLAIPVGELREFGEPTVAPRRRAWLDHEGVEALEALLEQALVRGEVQLDPMHEHFTGLAGRFASGFAIVEEVSQLEAQRERERDALAQQWGSLHPMFPTMNSGSYRSWRDGAIERKQAHRLMAREVDTLVFVEDGEALASATGSLAGCEDALAAIDPALVSPGGRARISTEGPPLMWTRNEGAATGSCGWSYATIEPLTASASVEHALHDSGWLARPRAKGGPTVTSIGEGKSQTPAWPGELFYGPMTWVDWEDAPMLAVAAATREGGPYNFLMLWHPQLGAQPYRAGLDTLGLGSAYASLHARPDHPHELLVSSRHEGGAVYRLRVPKEALEARLAHEAAWALADERARARMETPEMPQAWKLSTLVREEPFSELLVDPWGLRVATLARLPGAQSLRVVGIEEAQGVELEAPAAEMSQLEFDAEGAALISHMRIEASEGLSLLTPRRHPLPRSLHADALLRRESLLEGAQDEAVDPAAVDERDPEAVRELPTG